MKRRGNNTVFWIIFMIIFVFMVEVLPFIIYVNMILPEA